MKQALVVGATGLIGKHLTTILLNTPAYSVTALVRNPIDQSHERLKAVLFDFKNPDKDLVTGDELFCCLGTTIKDAGSKAAFYKVDFEYVVSVATMAYANGIKKLAIVSSMGADKNSAIFYNKVKGAVEEAVLQIGFDSVFIFRPSMLLGDRPSFRLGETIAKSLMTAFAFAVPERYKPVDASKVARAMIHFMGSGKTGHHILESDKIARLQTTSC